MKILVVGSGGREHALVWKLAQSKSVGKIYAAPGNPGIAEHAECAAIGADEIDRLAAFAMEQGIDLTVVGPEAPLVAGIADIFGAKGLSVFGFPARAAMLEGSKVHAKEFMARHGIPTGGFDVCPDAAAALAAIGRRKPPFVLKADGLAAGKGVIIAQTAAEAREAVERLMTKREFGAAGGRIVLEEFLEGEEVSILAITDGRSYRLLAPSQDHKRALDGDRGPNTGGMGAYAPVPLFSGELAELVRSEIVERTFEGMRRDSIAGAGILYFGLIITKKGPRVLEYNCRFGDPETQAVLPLLDGDLARVMSAAVSGNLDEVPFAVSGLSSACVVVASGGYPDAYAKGYAIEGLDEARAEGCIVFHAGTALKDGRVVTAGGRVLGITATAENLGAAIGKAYRGVGKIRFTDAFYRRDIGRRERRPM